MHLFFQNTMLVSIALAVGVLGPFDVTRAGCGASRFERDDRRSEQLLRRAEARAEARRQSKEHRLEIMQVLQEIACHGRSSRRTRRNRAGTRVRGQGKRRKRRVRERRKSSTDEDIPVPDTFEVDSEFLTDHLTASGPAPCARASTISSRMPRLHEACKNGESIQRILALVKDGAMSFAEQDATEKTPWHYLAYHNHGDVLSALLARGSDIAVGFDLQDAHGCTPLHYAAGNKDSIKAVTTLLAAGASVKTNDQEDRTPLQYAVRAGNIQAMQVLLSYGASVNDDRNSVLHCAVKSGQVDVVGELLKRDGIKVNQVDKYEMSPLDYAQDEHMRAELLKHGCVSHLEKIAQDKQSVMNAFRRVEQCASDCA